MLRLALIIDSPPTCRYVGDLLDGIAQPGDLSFTSLVLPARGAARRPARLDRVADAVVGFESYCLGLLGRLRPALARRIGARELSRQDIRSRFRQVIELAPGDDPAFDVAPDIVLVVGHWLPAAMLARCGPATAILQVELGGRPAQGLALAGFDECYAGADSTPVRLYRVCAADGSRVRLVDGRNRTKRLLSLNQAAAWDRALSLLRSRLPALDAPGVGTPVDRAGPADAAGPATAGRLAAYPLRVLGRGVRLAAQQLRGRRRWSVAIHRPAAPGEAFGPAAPVEAAPAGTYHADPILHRDPATGVAYCFVEEVDESINRGHIAVLRETDGRWHRLGIALQEPFHLSFPFLFRFDGKLYMCPESGACGEIRVYRCTDFPLRWTLETVLMREVSATDTVLFPHAGLWWMLTNLDRANRPDHQSELHLFHAASPLAADWQAVGANPVEVDCHGSRNGGLETEAGRLYRFGQVQSFDAYGHGLNRYEVTRLDVDGYEEDFRAAIAPPPDVGSAGIHTYSSIEGWVAVDLLGARPARHV